MPEADFEAAADEARDIEKSAQPYTGFKGKIDLVKAIDLYPKEFADFTFTDLMNLYERSEKIIKTAGMEIYGAPKAAPSPAMKKEIAARTEEVESRVKEITTEALTSAEELGKEMEKPIEKKPELGTEEAVPEVEEIELERLAPEKIEIEREKKVEEKEEEKPEEKPAEIEIEKEIEIKEALPEKPPEVKAKPKPAEVGPVPIERPAEKPAAAVPPILRERAEEAASKRYGEIEQQIMTTFGGEVDETSMKKKMLELTKELFKEKSVIRRERIKLEITVLKDMLTRKARAPKKGMEGKGAKDSILDTLVSTQKTELASVKDKMLTNYKNQVENLKQKFQENIAMLPESDHAGRKSAFENLVFELTSLGEQLPAAVSKYQDYIKEKHESEIRKFNSSLGKGEETLLKQSGARTKQIDDEYAKELATVRAIVKKSMDAVIESSGHLVFGKEKVPPKEIKVSEIVIEINETDEGTLLYYLHTKDPEFYKKYERKHLSKQEAIFRAKAMMAREKGLSDDMVKKYFSETEG